ncbi:MAG: hypothetical protein KF838_09770 [Phycisphaeraceae bacterium]|nr:MAG: hypothetical protein KF838_09770 [Phycisphaeraceae bacterium]
MSRDRIIQCIAAGVMLVCLVVSGALSMELTASVGRNQLAYTERAEDGDPPEVALGIAMGAFRGLFVNMLWIRANSLKEAGRYYEAIELSGAITRLQPRFPAVWAFHAWNMAYNISVTTSTADERWQWVQAGIQLLRDKGIPANPNAMLLHKELGWIYLHKIQGYTDDANNHYKRALAAEWTAVLGEPPRADPSDRSREAAIAKYVEWLRPIVEAPDSLDVLVKSDPAVASLVQAVQAHVAGAWTDAELLRRYALHQALERSGQREIIRSQMGARSAAFADLLSDTSRAEAWQKYVAQLRRRVLIDVYKMEPDRMVRFTQKYGPIDWRHPCAHGLYWSARGVEQGLSRATEETMRDYDFINTDRVVMQSLQELYRTGELYFDYLEWEAGQFATYISVPNPHFIEPYHQLVTSGELLDRNPYERTAKRPYRVIAAGYENFLKDAVCFFYRRGQRREAEKWYRIAANWEGANMHDPERIELFSMPLDEFVEKELTDRFKSPSVAIAEVYGALDGAYTSGLLAGDGELFRSQFEYAKRFHRYFLQEQLRMTPTGNVYGRLEMLDRDFGIVAGLRFANLVGQLSLDDAETVYDNAPEDLRRYAYDAFTRRFREALDAEVRNGGRAFDSIFPEPSNMASFRTTLARELEERRRTAERNVSPK